MYSLRKRLQSFGHSLLVRRILHVAGGNTVAQIIVLLFAPIITRLFSPENFGLQGVFLAAISLLAPIVALRFPMAIVLAKSDHDVSQVTRLSFRTILVTVSIIVLAIFFFRDGVATVLGLQDIGYLIYFLPIALAFTAWQEVVDYRVARRNEFRALSVVTAIQALLVNSARVVGGIFSPVGATLISVSTAGPGLHSLMLSRAAFRPRGGKPPASPRSSLWKLARELRDFPLLRVPTDFLNAASQTLPVILLAALFSPAIAGLYSLARSVLNVPSNVIGNAIGKVFYAHFADLHRRQRPISGVLAKSSLGLFLGPGLLIIGVCFFAPGIFGFVFGEQWIIAGVYAQWMSIWIAVALANVPSVRVAPVIGRQGTLLTANLVMTLIRIGTILAAYAVTSNALIVIAAYSLASAFSNAGLILWMHRLTLVHDREFEMSTNKLDAMPEIEEE